MKIRQLSVIVDDQEKALQFYTGVLGFVKKHDIPLGEFRWLTVVSPEEPKAAEVVLEPAANPASIAFTKSIREQGIPLAAFLVDDVDREYARLQSLGVQFTTPPTPMGPTKIAVLDDTCGNLIPIYQ